jgi:hypothetical protein
MNMGTNFGLVVGYKLKAPLLAKNARNGAPGLKPSDEETVREREVKCLTDEDWNDFGLIVSYKLKAPLLAKNARNGAPGVF